MSSKLTPVIAASMLVLYGISVRKLTANGIGAIDQSIVEVLPKHKAYGPIRFLTFQTLLAQFLSCLLHLLAHFAPNKLRKARDFVFTTIAWPLALIVALTFWIVWWIDRELIFPVIFDKFIPPWLNHTIHTLIVPVNLIFVVAEHHHYFKRGFLITAAHLALYLSLLIHIKIETGNFVYPYLDALGHYVYAYFVATILLAYTAYRCGALITEFVFGHAISVDSRKQSATTNNKVKQKSN